MPIFVRPVREQLEHDRLIRFLITKYSKKFEVAVNIGDEQTAPVKLGQKTFFPDVVLTANKKLAGLVEIETGESVNNLEAMAQWVHFSRSRVPFHLYIPVTGFDVAKRLCDAHGVRVAELWTYRPLADGFDLVRLVTDQAGVSTAAPAESKKPAPAAKPAVKAAAKTTPAPKPAPAAKAAPARKPAPKAPVAKAPAAKKAAKPAAKPSPAKATAKKAAPKAKKPVKPVKPAKSGKKSGKR